MGYSTQHIVFATDIHHNILWYSHINTTYSVHNTTYGVDVGNPGAALAHWIIFDMARKITGFGEAQEAPYSSLVIMLGRNVQRRKEKPTGSLVDCLWALCYSGLSGGVGMYLNTSFGLHP
jgi:hypothetical protein